jgi:uncharacterized repeat protein (TIGR03803 family)
MNITKLLMRRAGCILTLVVFGFGAGIGLAQTDGATDASIKYTVLHSFRGADGRGPYAGPLVQAADGDLYGTTNAGGANCHPQGCGTVFKISPSGAFTTLYDFCSKTNCTDGKQPQSGLLQASNGYLYGTTPYGGTNCGVLLGCGTVYALPLSGTLATIYDFCPQQPTCPDGEQPLAGLIQAANGDLYGTAPYGGAYGPGSIFKITPSGAFTTAYSFCPQTPCADGAGPSTALVQAENGDFYGTTVGGGPVNPSCPYYATCGNVFKIAPEGTLTALYNFCSQSNCTDGALPAGGLVQATDGNLYGMTLIGGANCLDNGGCGTIFKVTPDGTVTTFHSFCAQPACADGAAPVSQLIQSAAGDLYGIAGGGGANNGGSIFKITLDGNLTTLYSFCAAANCADGTEPYAGLVQGTDGVFYGTTYDGGVKNAGAIFSLSTGEAPFVTTQPKTGKAGEIVMILGYGLKGSTSVTFNGTPAKILYDAPTLIYATVPAGATTGKVAVNTADGTRTSSVKFEVIP